MLKDFDTEMTEFNGDVAKEKDGSTIYLRMYIVNALSAAFADETSLSGEEKFKRFELALKLNKGGQIDVNEEEISLMKKLVAKVYPPLIVGRVYQFLKV